MIVQMNYELAITEKNPKVLLDHINVIGNYLKTIDEKNTKKILKYRKIQFSLERQLSVILNVPARIYEEVYVMQTAEDNSIGDQGELLVESILSSNEKVFPSTNRMDSAVHSQQNKSANNDYVVLGEEGRVEFIQVKADVELGVGNNLEYDLNKVSIINLNTEKIIRDKLSSPDQAFTQGFVNTLNKELLRILTAYNIIKESLVRDVNNEEFLTLVSSISSGNHYLLYETGILKKSANRDEIQLVIEENIRNIDSILENIKKQISNR